MKLRVTVEIPVCPDGEHCAQGCPGLSFRSVLRYPYCAFFREKLDTDEFGALRCNNCKENAMTNDQKNRLDQGHRLKDYVGKTVEVTSTLYGARNVDVMEILSVDFPHFIEFPHFGTPFVGYGCGITRIAHDGITIFDNPVMEGKDVRDEAGLATLLRKSFGDEVADDYVERVADAALRSGEPVFNENEDYVGRCGWNDHTVSTLRFRFIQSGKTGEDEYEKFMQRTAFDELVECGEFDVEVN